MMIILIIIMRIVRIVWLLGNLWVHGTCDDATTCKQPSKSKSICRYYIAPSSIPNSGWGIYTAVDIQEGESVMEPDIVIPLVDMNVDNEEDEEEFHFGLDNYSWEADVCALEYEAEEVDAFISGPGAMPNCYLGMTNMGLPEMERLAPTSIPHRSTDPGVGGYSPYVYPSTTALERIAAGSELFVNYGQHWFVERSSQYGDMPLVKDLKYVESIVTRFVALQSQFLSFDNNHDNDNDNDDNALWDDLWTLIPTISTDRNRTRNAYQLVPHRRDMNKIVEVGLAQSTLPHSQREVEWLEQNGLCVDQLTPQQSNIPHAGNGAFSKQVFHKGDRVAPLPLLLIPDQNILTKVFHPPESKSTVQLLMNYCFGHGQSTLLLCPYGSVVNFVNHDATSPNVELQWSENVPGMHSEWFHQSVEDLKHHTKSGLMMEYRALTDIQIGDEIVLDYGTDWVTAWEHHLQQYNHHTHDSHYTSAASFRQERYYRTQEDNNNHYYYPNNILILCCYRNVWTDRIPIHGETVFARDYLPKDDTQGEYTPCHIQSREMIQEEDYYTVEILLDELEQEKSISHIVHRVPRHRIDLRDVAYTSDIHLPHAFRHSIGVPDDVFPDAWKNLL